MSSPQNSAANDEKVMLDAAASNYWKVPFLSPVNHATTARSGRIDGAPINQNEEREGREHGQTNLRKRGIACRSRQDSTPALQLSQELHIADIGCVTVALRTPNSKR